MMMMIIIIIVDPGITLQGFMFQRLFLTDCFPNSLPTSEAGPSDCAPQVERQHPLIEEAVIAGPS